MWANDLEMAKAIADQVLARMHRPQARQNNTPTPAPEPFKPEKPKKNETHDEMLKRRLRDKVRNGTAVTMNSIARDIPKPRLPRAPGKQQRQSNGIWSWWR